MWIKSEIEREKQLGLTSGTHDYSQSLLLKKDAISDEDALAQAAPSSGGGN